MTREIKEDNSLWYSLLKGKRVSPSRSFKNLIEKPFFNVRYVHKNFLSLCKHVNRSKNDQCSFIFKKIERSFQFVVLKPSHFPLR